MASFQSPSPSDPESPDPARQDSNPEVGQNSLRAEISAVFVDSASSQGRALNAEELAAEGGKLVRDNCVRELLQILPESGDVIFCPLCVWESHDKREVLVLCEVLDRDGRCLKSCGTSPSLHANWGLTPGLGHVANIIKYFRADDGTPRFAQINTVLATQELDKQVQRYLDDKPNLLSAEVRHCFRSLGLCDDSFRLVEAVQGEEDTGLRLAFVPKDSDEDADISIVMAVGSFDEFGKLGARVWFQNDATKQLVPPKPIVGLVRFSETIAASNGLVQDLELSPPFEFQCDLVERRIRLALDHSLNPAQKASLGICFHNIVLDVQRGMLPRLVFSCSAYQGGYLVPGTDIESASQFRDFVGLVWEISDMPEPSGAERRPFIVEDICKHLAGEADYSRFADAGYVISPATLEKMLAQLDRRGFESVLGQHLGRVVWEELVNQDLTEASSDVKFQKFAVRRSTLAAPSYAGEHALTLSFLVETEFGTHLVHCYYDLSDGFLDILSMGALAHFDCPDLDTEEEDEAEAPYREGEGLEFGGDEDDRSDEEDEDGDAWKHGAS
ncbi:MAG: hypothetical protein K1X79_13200 [Oligoflexia bacterium]|nr:hypothetical protein [Oligoflexia bacterium]